MPHLKYLDRYWRVGSDEFWLPGFCSMFGRIVWFIFTLVALSSSTVVFYNCPTGNILLTYFIISLLLLIISFICEAHIIKTSIEGTITDSETRDNKISYFLSCRAIVGFCQFIVAFFGCLIINSNTLIPCYEEYRESSSYSYVLLMVVIATQFFECIAILCITFILSTNQHVNNHLWAPETYDFTTIWKTRMRFVCRAIQLLSCNIFGKASKLLTISYL